MAKAALENVDPNMATAGGLGKPPKGKSNGSGLKPSRRRKSSIGIGKNGRHFSNNSNSDDDDDESVMTNIPNTMNANNNVNTNDQDGWSLGDSSSSEEEEEGEQAARIQIKKDKKEEQKQRARATLSITPIKAKGAGGAPASKPRRRRRSSARFVRLSNGAGGGGGDRSPTANGGNNSPTNNNDDDDYTSSQHLGEIYKQAIRMNAENKINAGNSWGLRLIENMDKFIEEEDNTATAGKAKSPRGGDGSNNGTDNNGSSRKKKFVQEKGRVNFTKASCTLDASVKMYSYRVDDVHLSSYRVLANLNRTDNKKDYGEDEEDGGVGEGGEEGGSGVTKAARRKNGERRHAETIESNLANINMSKLDAAYDIDPLFHKMSKSFDEGGAKGLLLGNLGVSSYGCHIVFDSKEELDDEEEKQSSSSHAKKLQDIFEETEEDEEKETMEVDETEQDTSDNNNENTLWKEKDIDISALSAKLDSMLLSYGVKSSDSVPFVPQLESLRDDYAILEDQGFAVDEKDVARQEGRKRSKLYDAPEEEEKEAERSIHHIALERSRGSVLGMSFDTNFRLSLDSDHGEGEFAPDFGNDGGDLGEEDDEFGGGGDGGFDNFMPDDDDVGFSSPSFKRSSGRRSYDKAKVLLDALCDGDAFLDDGAGGNSDYAFFDMSKLEKVTNGNMWAGSQHWKKMPGMNKNNKPAEKKKVSFGEDNEEKNEKKKASKKDRVYVDLTESPNVKSIFEKKKTSKRTKKTPADPFQLPKKKQEVDYLLPLDANVNIIQLTKLFSRPNAVVRRGNGDKNKTLGKTVGFYDLEENALGFDDAASFGGDNDAAGFDFAYDGADDDVQDDADYRLDDFEEVRKVEKIHVNYATVAKKVDVRRLKKDLWAELEAKTTVVPPEEFAASKSEEDKKDESEDGICAEPTKSGMVSFKETVEKMDMGQSQSDVTVSFYFICCLHLANEKGLKLDSTGLEDFMISLDDGSAPTFGTFGQEVLETSEKLTSLAHSRSKRERREGTTYEESDDEAVDSDEYDE